MTSSGRRQVARRALGNAVDQGVSSLSNAAAVLLVAGALPADDFGWFAVGMTAALLISNLTRPVSGILLVLVASQLDGAAGRAANRRAAGAAVCWGLGLGAAVLLAAAALPLPDTGRSVLLVAGLALPPLVLQDCLRYVCFRDGRPWRALLSDGGWLVVSLGAIIAMRTLGVTSAAAYLAVWAAGSAVGAALALLREGWLPDTRARLSFSWQDRRIARPVFTEQAASQGAAQSSVLLVGTVVGVSATGGLRGAQTLLGPLAVLQMAAQAFVVPELVRRPHLRREQRIGVALAVSLPLAAANLVYGALLAALPTRLGEALLGDAWEQTAATIVPMSVWAAAVALGIGPMSVLQAMGRADVTARISVVLAPLLLGGALLGAHLGGAPGAAWGLVSANTAVLLFWWPSLVVQSGRQVAAADPGEIIVEPQDNRPAPGRHRQTPAGRSAS